MADYGAEYADKKLRSVDKQLQKEYGQAEEELKKKLADFTAKSAARDKYKRKQLEAGIITEEEYQSWLKGQVFQKKRWEAKIRQMQFVLHSHNEQAAKMIHENKLDVYNENYFHQAYEMEMVTGASFDLYSTEAVTKLVRDRDQLLPEWKVDQKKDYNWNYDKVNNAVTQGILQGESVDKIMNRLAENLSSQNESKMRMFARTAITGAQSAGRQQQMNDAAKLGIEQLKQWLATLDGRTRDVHRHLDGQEVPFNEPFDSDLGKIKYPGDPEAAPANVYNCRCTVITIYPKYRKEQDDWRNSETIDGQTYKEWKEGKKRIIEEQEKQEDKNVSDPINEIKEMIKNHSGDWTTDDLVKIGDKFAEIVEKNTAEDKERYEKAKEEDDKIYAEIADIRKRINDLDRQRKYDEADVLEKQLHELEAKRSKIDRFGLHRAYENRLHEEVRATLGKIRECGGVTKDNLSMYADLSGWSYQVKQLREKTIEALNYYPRQWLEASKNYARKLCPHWTTGRAYYDDFYTSGMSEIRFDDGKDTNIHELGHRFEKVNPAILKAEKEFYEKRTKGEKLVWLGQGYRRNEKTRRDHFFSSYMGKDYGGTAYELVSMGFENIFTNYEGFAVNARDKETSRWILGILSAL